MGADEAAGSTMAAGLAGVREATRRRWEARVARAMALIAQHPRRLPDLETLAGAAALSPFHFHRVYRALTGETPAETLARERLSQAAVALLRGPSTEPIARIARRTGYGSAAAFTRAFRSAYGMPPAAYRSRGGIGLPARLGDPNAEKESIVFDVTIREEAPLRLIAMAHRGPYTDIGGAFDRLQAWATARDLLEPTTRYFGLYHDDPKTVPAAQLRSDACITVGSDVKPEDGLRVAEAPGGRVAVLRFRGPYAELEAAYEWLYGTWLPQSGEEPADAPVREEYLNDPRQVPPPELLTDIMVPLKASVPA